jgi:hypothetical protein
VSTIDAPTIDPATLQRAGDLDRGLAAPAAALDEARHRAAVERACELYRRCVRERDAVPAVFRPGGEWQVYIDERRGLYDAILAGETERASDLLRGFWRNELGAIVKEYAGYQQLIDREQPRTDRFRWNVPRNYLIWREMYGAAPEELAVPAVGEPWGLYLDDVLVTPKATRFHALATQAAELVRGRPTPTVAEIGAGYGGMAHYLLRDHPDVQWIDLDLPETLVIAAYWIIASLPDTDVTLHGERPLADAGPGAVLLPNHAITTLPAGSVDLTVNTFSFSEMPAPTLAATLDEVTRITRGLLLHHNMDRRGVVNRGHERIPASAFPIDRTAWRQLHRGFDLFHGQDGDYREYLEQRITETPRAC